jgi:arsenate reductase
MSEGLLRTLYGNRYGAFSVSNKPLSVNPYAVEVMKELGIDLSTYRSKSIEEFQALIIDYMVTVCNHAKEICPFFPGKQIFHKEFDDPSIFDGSVEEILSMFRRVRDEIKEYVIDEFG